MRIPCSGHDDQRPVAEVLKRTGLRQRCRQFGELVAQAAVEPRPTRSEDAACRVLAAGKLQSRRGRPAVRRRVEPATATARRRGGSRCRTLDSIGRPSNASAGWPSSRTMPATCSGYRPAKILTYCAPDEWPTSTNGPGTCARSSRMWRSVATRRRPAGPTPDRSSLDPRDRRRTPSCRVRRAVEIHPQ